MTDIIIPTGDMPVTAKVTTVGKGIIAAQVSAAGAELAQDAAKAATEATEATKEATDNANNATAAAKTATSDAKKATTAANSAADAAKTATTNANNATSAAKTATTNANTATDAAKTATTAANEAADRANTAAGSAESIVSGAVATPQKTGVVYIADSDGATAGTQYNTACSMAFYNTAASATQDQITGLNDALAGKADATHTHAIADTTGLQAALNSKANATHTHAIADVTGLQAALYRIWYGYTDENTEIVAHGYHDFNITFPKKYNSPPNVQLTILTHTKATTSFDCDISLRSVSTTGFTARIINRENSNRSPGISWLAVGQ